MENGHVLLSLGGNLGDMEKTFASASELLEKGGFRIIRRSGIYRSPAEGCEEGAPDFSNIAVLGEWGGDPVSLLNLCRSTEEALGRPANHPHMRSRTLDADIILFGDITLDIPELTIPHPRAKGRKFVTVPSAEIGITL